MNIETVRRISLARHLYELGISSLRSKNDFFLFSAVNLLQDSVEAFLIAIAVHVDASIDQNTKFDKYFVEIDKKIVPKTLPFKLKLLRLNRIRVSSKHYGIQPARDECDSLSVVVREFFDEVSAVHLGTSFSTVSTIDLLEDNDTKKTLLEAKTALEAGDHVECAINCRKAIFLEIELDYDISRYKHGKLSGLSASFDFSKAPYFARDKGYIQDNVKDPTDYIVYDHNQLNQDLLIRGVDNTSFWNVWRLTPEVYRTRDRKWIVKHDFAKLDANLLSDKIEYIFSTTIDIIFTIHSNRRAAKTADYQSHYLELTQENVSVFEKADKNSVVMGTTPSGMLKIHTDFYVEGLQEDGRYWHVIDTQKDILLYGFIHNDYVKSE